MSPEENRIRHERAREQGRQARRAGKKRTDNPYRLGSSTNEHDAWLLGFDEAAQQMRQRR